MHIPPLTCWWIRKDWLAVGIKGTLPLCHHFQLKFREVTQVRKDMRRFLGHSCIAFLQYSKQVLIWKESMASWGSAAHLLSHRCTTVTPYWLWVFLTPTNGVSPRILCWWGIGKLCVNGVSNHTSEHANCPYLLYLHTYTIIPRNFTSKM